MSGRCLSRLSWAQTPFHDGVVWALQYWEGGGFQRPSLKQGAAGTMYFEPGGVSFRELAGNRENFGEQSERGRPTRQP
jgi:hypothetical protein